MLKKVFGGSSHKHHDKHHHERTATAIVNDKDVKEVVVEERVHAPVVQETRREVQTEVVSAHVDREREQTRVEQVIQPIVDKRVATEVHEVKTDRTKEIVRGSAEMSAADRREYERAAHLKSKTVDLGVEKRKIVEAPSVTETVKQRVVEEVIPVIQRETVVPHVIHHEKPVHEKIIERTTLHQTTKAPMTLEEAQRRGLPVGDIPKRTTSITSAQVSSYATLESTSIGSTGSKIRDFDRTDVILSNNPDPVVEKHTTTTATVDPLLDKRTTTTTTTTSMSTSEVGTSAFPTIL